MAVAGILEPAERADAPLLMGEALVRLPSGRAMTEWQSMLAAFHREQRIARARAGGPWRQAMMRWQALIAPLAGLPQLAQIRAVHARLRRIPYASDRDTYGVADHWATPYETLRLGRGDCEDVAIAMYFALRELGFAADRLRVGVGYLGADGRGHAVALVDSEAGLLVLDPRRDRPVGAALVHDLHLLYSVNERRAWLHFANAPAVENVIRPRGRGTPRR